jgi:hypothetical protein
MKKCHYLLTGAMQAYRPDLKHKHLIKEAQISLTKKA